MPAQCTENIELRAECGHVIEQAIDIFDLGQIARDGRCRLRAVRQLARNRIEPGAVTSDDDRVDTRDGERLGNRGPDATASPRNESPLLCQGRHVPLLKVVATQVFDRPRVAVRARQPTGATVISG